MNNLTWTKSSYIDPVVSKTNAREEVPGGAVASGDACLRNRPPSANDNANTNIISTSSLILYTCYVIRYYLTSNLIVPYSQPFGYLEIAPRKTTQIHR